MPIFIRIMIALGVICLLRVLIWQDSKTNPLHLKLKKEFGNQAVSFVNYLVLLLIGSGVIVAIFSFPSSLGLLISGVLGLIGCLIVI